MSELTGANLESVAAIPTAGAGVAASGSGIIASGSAATASRAAAARHEWLDYGKGICIVAVVTMYTTAHVTYGLGDASWMQYWVDFARPFRMPDFFFISGLLLAKVIDRPWRSYLDKKVVHYLYFFVIWSLLYFATRAGVGHAGDTAAELWHEFVKVMTYGPFAMLWFIQMLPFYFVLTKVLRRIPWPVVLAAAAVWHLLPIETPWSQVNRAGERFVFFYAGYVFAPQAFAFARRVVRQRAAALLGLLAWAVVNGGLVFGGYSGLPGLSLLLGFLGAFAVIGVAALLHSVHRADWLRHCGEQSLPVYLGFFMPMSLLMSSYLAVVNAFDVPVLDAGVLSLVLAAASIMIALAASRVLQRTPLALLYERPRWARVERPAVPPRQAPAAARRTTALE